MIDISTKCSRFQARKSATAFLTAIWTRHAEASRIGRELSDSSDRALAEIGIARGDIDAIAHGRFGRS